jgi:acyl CoA:acetate/3-ketoacid CoA transferase alpha subunit
MATAATTTVVQVKHVVEPGSLDPEAVVTPGIYVDRIVQVPPSRTWCSPPSSSTRTVAR